MPFSSVCPVLKSSNHALYICRLVTVEPQFCPWSWLWSCVSWAWLLPQPASSSRSPHSVNSSAIISLCPVFKSSNCALYICRLVAVKPPFCPRGDCNCAFPGHDSFHGQHRVRAPLDLSTALLQPRHSDGGDPGGVCPTQKLPQDAHGCCCQDEDIRGHCSR